MFPGLQDLNIYPIRSVCGKYVLRTMTTLYSSLSEVKLVEIFIFEATMFSAEIRQSEHYL